MDSFDIIVISIALSGLIVMIESIAKQIRNLFTFENNNSSLVEISGHDENENLFSDDSLLASKLASCENSSLCIVRDEEVVLAAKDVDAETAEVRYYFEEIAF